MPAKAAKKSKAKAKGAKGLEFSELKESLAHLAQESIHMAAAGAAHLAGKIKDYTETIGGSTSGKRENEKR